MAEILEDMSKELAGVVEAAGPTVLRVEGRRRLPASGIAWSGQGIVVTANHVVERDERLRVSDGAEDGPAAELVGRDPTTDLAVLRADGLQADAANWADSEGLRVGHLVLALGRPGRTVQATLGIVSALGEAWRTHSGGMVDRYLQTDVVMYPGFSGGALIDTGGQVLGLNTSALRGVSLTIPTATVRRVVEAILTHGRVRRGYLGVGVQAVQLPAAVAGEVGQETGLILVSVEPGSAADTGGLLLGDTLLALDGQAVRQLDELLDLLGQEMAGKQVVAQLLRGGKLIEQQLTVGERE